MDPILRMMLQLYASQLAQIDSRIDQTWDKAVQALLKSVVPESRRWPVPAYTVMRCQPRDPVVEIDPYTRFFYRERRDGGQTFFFSATRKTRLLAAHLRHLIYVDGSSARDLMQSADGRPVRVMAGATSSETANVYAAIEFAGQPSALRKATLYIKGSREIARQFRWAYWHPSNGTGQFNEQSCFCPGLTTTIENLFPETDGDADWGGLRTTADLFRSLEDYFVVLPEQFANDWQVCAAPEEIRTSLTRSGIPPIPPDRRYYWIRLELPRGGDRLAVQPPIGLYLDSFIALNKNELRLFKHTGGNRLIEIELPEELSEILELSQVTDSLGREYKPRHEMTGETGKQQYAVEERERRLVLWFDFFNTLESPPDALTVTYAITAGTAANGIEAGKINELYENHPGIQSAENLIPTAGAIPAKTDAQVVDEMSARLRNRNRALTFDEIANWAKTFDPRIRDVVCENGVERGERGVHRCIRVRVSVGADDLYSHDEARLLKSRLHSFLKARSGVNTQFAVEVAAA
ncbi:MAG: hypothetical protein AB1644_09215 [Candidatus Zixiibacteriota bacterium]